MGTPVISEHNYHLLRAAEHEITRLASLDLHYGWGGGRNCGNVPCTDYNHGDIAGDCSWLAAVACDKLGRIVAWPGNTYTLAIEGHEGHGRMFTMHIKNFADPAQSHVILEFKHHKHTRWAECGGFDNPSAFGGPSWFRPSEERVSEFPIKRHFKGF